MIATIPAPQRSHSHGGTGSSPLDTLLGGPRSQPQRHQQSRTKTNLLATTKNQTPRTTHNAAAKLRAAARQRAAALLSLPLDFIGHEEFHRYPTTRVLSDLDATSLPDTSLDESLDSRLQSSSGMGGYLEHLYESRLLTPAEESEVFRRMNLAKCHAALLRESLVAVRPSVTLMDRIDKLLQAARAARDLLICSNLRLVVSIAKKFVGDDGAVDDLVSEGHLALFRAVEKFNYARGFRFSTYATHAIRRQIYRLVVKRQRERRRATNDGDEILPAIAAPEVAEATPSLAMAHAAVERAVQRLDPRERMIVRARFGISTGGQQRTLIDLAGQLGVCKERVRQLEIRALKKLRAAMEKDNIHAALLEG